ncbi:hypothetical protein CR513_41922, partial [Mucuna pruriens]
MENRNYMFYSFIHDIWENLIEIEIYSMKKDSTACYELKARSSTLEIIKYYETLNELWIELDQYQGLEMCKIDSIAYTGFFERGRIFNSDSRQGKTFLSSEETRRSVMLDKGSSNIGFAMVPQKDQPPKENSSQRVVVGNTASTAIDWNIPRIPAISFIERRKCGLNQTTSNKGNVVEHPSTLQLDQDIQAFSKEEMICLQALLNSTSKHLDLCALTMKGKSCFNIFGSYSNNNSLLLLMEIMFLLLDLTMSIFNALYPYTMFFMFLNWLTTLSLYIGLYKIKIDLTMKRTIEKLEQLIKFGFIINVLNIHRLVYFSQCFHIYLQKSLLSPLIVMFVSCQNTIVQNFLLVNLFYLIHSNVWGQLVTLYRGLSGLYHILMIVPM